MPGIKVEVPHTVPDTRLEPIAVPSPVAARDLVLRAAALLFAHGQTTERTVEDTARLAAALGLRATLFPRWDSLTLCADDRVMMAAASPLGVDMGKVAATVALIDETCARRVDAAALPAALAAIERRPPVSVLRFAAMAGAGAAALGVIFGGVHPLSLVLIALSAAAGGWLRRWLAGISRNAFVQPFCAALLAGAIGAVVVRLQLSTAERLVAVCPCMVLVPGPHLLNGAIDLARARISLGAARIGFALLVVAMICTGLLAGLALGGVTLPVSGAAVQVALGYDVIAAGVAVAAYGTFFAMPWRRLPVPVAIGMAAHAARWGVLAAGGSAEAGAFAACLLVGIVATPVADRLRLPFAAFAFAAVVSLIPGVFLFRLAGGLVALLDGGAAPALLPGIATDGATATLILLAMAFGLILPKMLIEHIWPHTA